MWFVKTSMWSVSGLRKNHRFERALRHAAKQHIFFSHWLQKNFSLYFAFSIFLHKFANVNHVRNLIGWCRVRPLWLSANAEARRGWGTAAHEERFDCVEHIFDEGVYLTLCSRHLETSQTFIVVRNEATVDVHGCVITSRRYTLLYIRYAKGAIYIQAWASALLVQLRWAMRRPPSMGRVMVWLPRFFRICIINRFRHQRSRFTLLFKELNEYTTKPCSEKKRCDCGGMVPSQLLRRRFSSAYVKQDGVLRYDTQN